MRKNLFFACTLAALVWACNDIERLNSNDPQSENYAGASALAQTSSSAGTSLPYLNNAASSSSVYNPLIEGNSSSAFAPIIPASSSSVSKNTSSSAGSSPATSSSATPASSSSIDLSNIPSSQLWPGPNFQVNVPCVANKEYLANDYNGDGSYNFLDCAGWFFFAFTNTAPWSTTSPSGTASPKGSSYSTLATNLTPASNQTTNLLPDYTLWTNLTAYAALSSSGPGEAGLAFEFNIDTAPIDITDWGGFCLTYSLTGNPMRMALEWDGSVYGYDFYFASLPTGTRNTLNLSWSAFVQEGYNVKPATYAQKYPRRIEFKLKNTSTTKSKSSTFYLHKLGKYGSCN